MIQHVLERARPRQSVLSGFFEEIEKFFLMKNKFKQESILCKS